MAAESNNRRRWFGFGPESHGAPGSEVALPTRGDQAIAERDARRTAPVAHAIEDVLFGIAMIALAFDERVPGAVVREVVGHFLDARREGRAAELVAAAREVVASLSDWECEACRESNPATFEICWNCDQPAPTGLSQPSDQAKIVLGIESMSLLRTERKPETPEDRNSSATSSSVSNAEALRLF